MGLFKKRGGDERADIRGMVEDLQQQHQQLADSTHSEQQASGQRVSVVLSDLETYMAKLETIIERLANITEELEDSRIKPWYVRIFCP